MLKRIKIKIENIQSQKDKALIETEIDILKGVKSINVDEKTGECWVEFEDTLISEDKILKAITALGYKIKEKPKIEKVLKEHLYFVKGMHCASCEILIEKKLLSIKGVKSVEAKAEKGEILIEYEGKRPSVERLNKIFKSEGYVFFRSAKRNNKWF